MPLDHFPTNTDDCDNDDMTTQKLLHESMSHDVLMCDGSSSISSEEVLANHLLRLLGDCRDSDCHEVKFREDGNHQDRKDGGDGRIRAGRISPEMGTHLLLTALSSNSDDVINNNTEQVHFGFGAELPIGLWTDSEYSVFRAGGFYND